MTLITLHAADSIFAKLIPGKDIVWDDAMNQVMANAAKFGRPVGLHSSELTKLLASNLTGIADVVTRSRVKPAGFKQFFSNGNIIALVDRGQSTGHYVVVNGTDDVDGSTYVKLYDPEYGDYWQLLDDFSTRCDGVKNFFIQVLP